MRELVIGLDRWVLQDGNYTDFAVGDRRQFALEFGYRRRHRLDPVGPAPRRTIASRGSGCWYDVVAQVVTVRPAESDCLPAAFVLDCGAVSAYDHGLVTSDLTSPAEGSWLQGRLSLHVDHFAYMDELGTLPGMPPLIRTWDVLAIEEDHTPLVRVEPGHPLYEGPPEDGPIWVADPARERYEPVDRTVRWPEDERASSYRLRCRLLDDEPEHTMRRTGPRSPYGTLPRLA